MEETIQPAEEVVEAMPEVLALAEGFTGATREQWEAQVVRTLNRGRPDGAQLDAEQCLDRLRTRTIGGLQVEPLYTGAVTELGEPGRAPFRRGSRPAAGAMDAWDVRALHDDPDVATTREAVLADLERGATSLWLVVGDSAIAAAALPDVLSGVELDLAPVVLSSEDDQIGAARALLEVCRERGTTLAPGSNLGLDPVALAAVTGSEVDVAHLGDVVREAAAHPGTRALTVDATCFHDAGGSDVDELALALATGVAYLRALEEQGVDPATAAEQLEFRVSASADQFLTIARLRALRVLWARVGEACGIPEEQRGARQHAVTSWRMLTRDDPWVNLLRATTAVFAAAAGGAEAITVLPHDHVHGYPDAFSRRVARNTQVVLAEESNIGRVADPAGGSWYVESLTDDLAAAAWATFQRIEKAGGVVAALAGGTVAELLEASRRERADRLARREAAITGVSSFPAIEEQPLERRRRPGRAGGGLPRERDAEVFEALRDRSARHAETVGAPPTVLLAALGTRRDFGARETFTTSLLAVGGVRAHLVEGAEGLSAEALGDALTATGAREPVAIVCSSPAQYAEHGAASAQALRDAGAGRVLLAGSVSELSDPAGEELVDGTVHAGMDVVAFLADLLDTLGVAR